MTAAKSVTAAYEAAERRGDDTHWWKAYQLHSEVALAMKAHTKLLSRGNASQSSSVRKSLLLTETEIHRAANEALRLPQARPFHVAQTRDCGPARSLASHIDSHRSVPSTQT